MQQMYRCFDERGRLLYIGISINAMTRAAQHRRTSPWWHQVRRIDIATIGTSRVQAERAELAAIRSERPAYNVVGTERPRWTAPAAPRYWDPSDLVARMGMSAPELARRLKVDPALLTSNLDDQQADWLCTKLGYHPSEVWADWLAAS